MAKIHGAEAWGLLVLVISMAYAGKIIETFVVAIMCIIPAREALTLGILMNTKGGGADIEAWWRFKSKILQKPWCSGDGSCNDEGEAAVAVVESWWFCQGSERIGKEIEEWGVREKGKKRGG